MSNSVEIYDLAVNQLKRPFGIIDPSFSWKLRSQREGAAQCAWRIRIFNGRTAAGEPEFDSDETSGRDTFGIKFKGFKPKAARAYSWIVSVKDETGAWTDSAPAIFETGLVDPAVWDGAAWIAAGQPQYNDHDTTIFLKSVENKADISEAWWFVTAQGVFEAYVNGKPVSHLGEDGFLVRDALKPGFTHCFKRRHYFSYDVTHLVKADAGEKNSFAALVTGGWWRDQITGHKGKESAFRAILVLRHADGSEETVPTDASWSAAFGSPIDRADIFYGEDYDARVKAQTLRWMEEGAFPWQCDAIRILDEFKGETLPLKGPPVRQRDDIALAPVSIRVWSGIEEADDTHYGRIRVVREYKDGDQMILRPGENLQIDFGQNAAAVPDFAFSASNGTHLVVSFAEMLNDGRGAFERNNDGPEGELYKRNYRDARAEIHYVFSGAEGGETYRPQFTFFGYRYLSVSCERGVVTLKKVRSIPVTSVARDAETGTLETGVALVNRLVANGIWGQRSNYLSVPTDCPQRNERLGWAADTQVFTPTACFNTNVYSFLDKWMDDMDDSQHTDADYDGTYGGAYPGVAPDAQYGQNPGAVGWADAGIVVPHVLWRMFGDTAIVDAHFDAMTRYMDYVDSHEGPNPEPWGEWLAYERNDLAMKKYLSSAYWVWDCIMMHEMASATGRSQAAKRFADSEARARAVFKAKHLGADGQIVPEMRCQAADLFALFLDLVEGEAAQATTADLLANIKAHGDCLQTGFLGTAIIMDTLTKIGAGDVAYTLLLQRKNPSWLYSIDQGATTFWERWNSYTKDGGFGDAGMNSFNHYAYGAVVSWIYSSAAGIACDPASPGFRHFFLRPLPDRRLGRIKASYDSACGLIESAWEYGKDGSLIWRYTIPANTTATVTLPDGKTEEKTSGSYTVVI